MKYAANIQNFTSGCILYEFETFHFIRKMWNNADRQINFYCLFINIVLVKCV